jgi:hypothetical protein
MSAKNPGNPGRSIGSWSDKPWSDEDGNDRTVFPFGPFCCLLLLPRHWCRDPLAANKRDNRRGARDESSRVESRGQEIASGEGQVAARNDLLRAWLNEVWTRSPFVCRCTSHAPRRPHPRPWTTCFRPCLMLRRWYSMARPCTPYPL